MRKSKFPAKLYVKTEWDKDAPYFVATETIDEQAEMGERVKVGVYSLTSVKEVTTKIEAK